MSRRLTVSCAIVAGFVSLASALAGCSGATALFPAAAEADTAQLSKVDRIFRLGVGDKLKVDVFSEPEMSGESEVNASGDVVLPLLGQVPAKGRSLDEFAAVLRDKLGRGYLKNPQVAVQVLNYRPIYVQGEVKRGGEFPFKPGLSFADAIALAGGYSYRAQTSTVLLRRQGEGVGRLVSMDGSVPVLPGDNLTVEERFF